MPTIPSMTFYVLYVDTIHLMVSPKPLCNFSLIIKYKYVIPICIYIYNLYSNIILLRQLQNNRYLITSILIGDAIQGRNSKIVDIIVYLYVGILWRCIYIVLKYI